MSLFERLQRASAWRNVPQRWHTPLLVLSGTVFFVGSVLAYRGLDIDWQNVNVVLLLIVLLVGTPATIAMNGAELRVIAAIEAVTLPWMTALRTVVLATAANMLPLPGAAVVRTHTLVSHGVALAAAVRAILAAALCWVGVSAVLASAAAASFSGVFALALGVFGSAAVVIGAAVLRTNGQLFWQLIAVELVTTVLHAVRLWLVFIALTITVDIREPFVLAAASPLAAAAGVFPSGLGLSEAIAAGMAATIGLSAAAGFAATALMRVIGLAGTAVVALVLGANRHDSGEPARPNDSDGQA
ncbi:MAG: hypothetical protein WD360_02820 [Nitriliruptoraceae bacterium]